MVAIASSLQDKFWPAGIKTFVDFKKKHKVADEPEIKVVESLSDKLSTISFTPSFWADSVEPETFDMAVADETGPPFLDLDSISSFSDSGSERDFGDEFADLYDETEEGFGFTKDEEPAPELSLFASWSTQSFSDIVGDYEHERKVLARAELMEVPSIRESYREYRRFRHYDLIRTRIGLLGGALQPPVAAKVQFAVDPSVKEFQKDAYVPECAVDSHFTPVPILHREPENYETMSTKRFFEFRTGSGTLFLLLRQIQSSILSLTDIDRDKLEEFFSLAVEQGDIAAENVLGAFEGVGSLGKEFVSVLNRLLACAVRFLVLSDYSEVMEMDELSEYRNSLVYCLYDCDELQSAILRLEERAIEANDYLNLYSENIAMEVANALAYFDRVEHIHTYLQGSESLMEYPDYSTYAGVIDFLKTKNIPLSLFILQSDILNILDDVADVEERANLLMDQTQHAYLELLDVMEGQ